MNASEKDYLQVFLLQESFDGKQWRQKIIHTQEQPFYMMEHLLKSTHIVNARIYVIDDITHCTMLLAEEY